MAYATQSTDPNATKFYALRTEDYIDSPGITSTGTKTFTGSVALTGDFSLIDAPEAVAGATDLASSADLTNAGYQAITSTSGALKKYLLDTPVAGAVKKLSISNAGAGDVYIYASASSAYTAYFGANTSANILAMTTPSILVFTLLGASTAQWLLTSISTLNNGTTGTIAIASSNS